MHHDLAFLTLPPDSVYYIGSSSCWHYKKKLYKALLPKLGANQSYPQALHHSPPALFGLGLPILYWEQGAAALCLFLEVGNGYSVDSHFLQCLLEQAQLELGLSFPFFQADFHQYSFLLTNCWVKFIWSFLAYSDLALYMECPPELGPQQVNDQFLMEAFFSSGQFTNNELISINRCCLAKKALTVRGSSRYLGYDDRSWAIWSITDMPGTRLQRWIVGGNVCMISLRTQY